MSTDFLRQVTHALDRIGVPYMLTGSFAAAWYGAGRATADIDLVIDATQDQLHAIVDQFPAPRYYASLESAVEAREQESQFNVIDLESGWKVDLLIKKSRPFSQTEFDRRVPVDRGGLMVQIVTVEDLILAKLEWAKLGDSARQREDVARLLQLRAGQLDIEHLERWATSLDLGDEWAAARRAIRPPESPGESDSRPAPQARDLERSRAEESGDPSLRSG